MAKSADGDTGAAPEGRSLECVSIDLSYLVADLRERAPLTTYFLLMAELSLKQELKGVDLDGGTYAERH